MKKNRIVAIAVVILLVFAAVSCKEPESVVKTDVYVGTVSELETAIAEGVPNIHLSADLNVSETIVIRDKVITLDLAGKRIGNASDLWDEETGDWSLISLQGNEASLTIKGNGKLVAKDNDCYAVDVRNGASLTIEDGTYVGNIHAVYVYGGSLMVKGGTFSVVQKYSNSKPDEFVLNCYDAAYKNDTEDKYYNGRATIVVSGGTFAGFNPANCQAEGANTNFLAEGYKTTSKEVNGTTWWTVEKK